MNRIPAPYVVSKRLGTFERIGTGGITSVKGYAVRYWNFSGYEFFVYQDDKLWDLCERSTGMALVAGANHRSDALKWAFFRLIEQRKTVATTIAANQMPKQRKGK